MNMDDIKDMKLKDIINEYFVLYSPECDYIYGIAHIDVLDELFEEYDINDENSASISTTNLLSWDALEFYDEDFLTIDKIDIIMENLDIKKKKVIDYV